MADALAAWVGAAALIALSFVPSFVAPTESMRQFAAWLARIVTPAPIAGALWTTLAWFGFASPPAGILLYALYPPLLIAIGLGGWGVGLFLAWVVEYWSGWRPPTFLSVLFGLGAVAWAILSR